MGVPETGEAGSEQLWVLLLPGAQGETVGETRPEGGPGILAGRDFRAGRKGLYSCGKTIGTDNLCLVPVEFFSSQVSLCPGGGRVCI